MTEELNLRTATISEIENALKDKPTNVVIKDSKDREFIYDLAKYFRGLDNRYSVMVGPHNNQYCLIVGRLA